MARRIRGGGVAALAAALVFGSMTGSALADDAKKDRKEQKRIGEAVAEKELYVGKLALFDAKQIALGNLALEKTQDEQVRTFAQKLVDDHKQHLSGLKAWADSKQIEVATIDLNQPASGTGGSGAMQEGYDKKMEGVDERLNKAITEAEKDLDKLREKSGKDFDKDFLSRVADDGKKGQDMVADGMKKYETDAAFSELLRRTRQGIASNERQAKEMEKALRR
ncbi:DUF4142 domain-containing protein [Myxococcus sp. MISCRS1]|jgi:predicted outer membrane protein|uniref:DUF4142 domain-containing protein n=1 Tax=Myxococcus TaxID=32 RepID=UPI001CBF4E23|nr:MULTISPECIES: DUF4142 domain-containing protein [unclassified Myxococcus]MCY0999032.1 DUF4142 domain-containing protein [Myxococcus sp. MISCRS1]BDT30964.1 DUF4142 domain-containing protein [Myxococcus sp. MH1]